MDKYKKFKKYLHISILVSTVLLFIKAFTYKPEFEIQSPVEKALGVAQTKSDYVLDILFFIVALLFIVRIIIAFEEYRFK